jgi:hypothetical protein
MRDRDLLRHSLAVLAYRAGKPLRSAPPSFATFSTGAGAWTPVGLVAHLADLMEWALTIVQGAQRYQEGKPGAWDVEVQRFWRALAAFDAWLAAEKPIDGGCERLLAGPIADALTHTGQLAMLRRMAGVPIQAESYYVAEIKSGQVGPEQPPPVKPFTRKPA